MERSTKEETKTWSPGRKLVPLAQTGPMGRRGILGHREKDQELSQRHLEKRAEYAGGAFLLMCGLGEMFSITRDSFTSTLSQKDELGSYGKKDKGLRRYIHRTGGGFDHLSRLLGNLLCRCPHRFRLGKRRQTQRGSFFSLLMS